MNSFAIIGLGLFGEQLASDLYSAGHQVLAIDKSEKKIEAIADSVNKAVTLDATDRDALSYIGIQKYDCVVVSISGDLASSVLITMNLAALKVPYIVCKVKSDTDKEVLEKLGASYCIFPEQVAAIKLSRKLVSRNLIDFTIISDNHSIIEICVPHSWIGKNIAELNIRSQYGVNIIALKDRGEIIVNLNPFEPLKSSDILIIIGSNKNIERLQRQAR